MELQAASTEALVRTPVEPKLFFANERTYLHCERCPTLALAQSLTSFGATVSHRARATQGCMHA